MASECRTPDGWGPRLATALRAIRVARGLTTTETASRMRLDRRNYANFEAGKGRLNLERVIRFAEVTDSDPWAILAAVLMGSPGLARDAADNKLVLVFHILLAEFAGQVGERVRDIETADAVSAFQEAFRGLEAAAVSRTERRSADWLKLGLAKLGLDASAEDDTPSS